jgi:hypothetical protein
LHIGDSGSQFRFQDDLIAYDTGNFIGYYFLLRKAGGCDKEKAGKTRYFIY